MIGDMILIYIVSMFITSIINAVSKVRVPKNPIDLFILTFLPYVVYKLITNPKDIQR